MQWFHVLTERDKSPQTEDEWRRYNDLVELRELMERIYSLGFKPADLNDIFEKDNHPAYVSYFARQWRDEAYKGTPHKLPPFEYQYLTVTIFPLEHQYLTLEPFENRFLEASFIVYAQPFNAKAKNKQVPLFSTLLRSLDDIVIAANGIYTPVKSQKDG